MTPVNVKAPVACYGIKARTATLAGFIGTWRDRLVFSRLDRLNSSPTYWIYYNAPHSNGEGGQRRNCVVIHNKGLPTSSRPTSQVRVRNLINKVYPIDEGLYPKSVE